MRARTGDIAPIARRRPGRPVLAAIRRVFSEPLIQFLLLGGLLYLATDHGGAGSTERRIEVTKAHAEKLAKDYALQFGAPPDQATREALIEADIHDEISFREGLQLGLDQGDPIIRRRIVQKFEFLMQDTSVPGEPGDSDLRTYYANHAGRYVAPARVSFSHIFFSDGPDAQKRARALKASLRDTVTRAPERGDAFPDLYDYAAFEPAQAERLFGRTPLTQALFTAETGRWVGPFQSAYGWHLVRISARTPEETRTFDSVRPDVLADYLKDRQDQANRARFDALAKKYSVIRADRGGTP